MTYNWSIKPFVNFGSYKEVSEIEEFRVCRVCGETLPVSEFYVRKDRPGEKVYRCKKCAAKWAREYRRKNPEKVKETAAQTRNRNREKIIARQREDYAKKKDDPIYKARRKASYDKNKHKYHANDRAKREAFNQKWKHPCEKCGESRLYVIQFHHIDPATKKFCIGANASTRKDIDLEQEVKKCVCLCSNCHDEFHFLYGGKPENPIEALKEYLGKEDLG